MRKQKQSPCRRKPKDEAEWKMFRQFGIGSSDSAAIVGASNWKTVRDLWMEKTGNKQPKDLSDNEFIQKGVRLEPAIREVFKALHPKRKITYHKYDMLYQPERPFIFATLDGEQKDENGRLGCLEIKTNTPRSASDWKKWEGQIPQGYYIQCLHELLASGYEFVDLFAFIFQQDGDFVAREYHIERADAKEDLDWLLNEEIKFWDSVEKKKLPGLTLVI